METQCGSLFLSSRIDHTLLLVASTNSASSSPSSVVFLLPASLPLWCLKTCHRPHYQTCVCVCVLLIQKWSIYHSPRWLPWPIPVFHAWEVSPRTFESELNGFSSWHETASEKVSPWKDCTVVHQCARTRGGVTAKWLLQTLSSQYHPTRLFLPCLASASFGLPCSQSVLQPISSSLVSSPHPHIYIHLLRHLEATNQNSLIKTAPVSHISPEAIVEERF